MSLKKWMYEGCSESNCWWYGSRGWTFPPVFYYILLPRDRRQQRSSLTEWRLMWKCVWNKGVELNSSMQKKLHPLTFIDARWMFMETKQWVWAQWSSGQCFSAVSTVTCWQFMFQMAMHSCHTTKWRASPSGHPCESADYDQGTVSRAEHWLRCVGNYGGSTGILKRWVPQMLIRNRRTLYTSLSEPIQPIQGLRWLFPGLHSYPWGDVMSPR